MHTLQTQNSNFAFIPNPMNQMPQANIQGPNPGSSPHSAGGKRRRASTVKAEGEDGSTGGEVNGGATGKGGKVKASPKSGAGGGKKQKGAS